MLLLALGCHHHVQHRTPQVAVRTLADDGWIAVRWDLDPGWHVYWVNPGDSGMATDVRSSDPRVGAPQFPAPTRFVSPGPIESFGYADQLVVLLPFEGTDPVQLDAAWLVCKEACHFQEALLTVDPARTSRLDRHVDALPRPGQAIWSGDGWTLPAGEVFPSASLQQSGATIDSTPDGVHIDASADGTWLVLDTGDHPLHISLEAP